MTRGPEAHGTAGKGLIGIDAALAAFAPQVVSVTDVETVPLAAALGRVLALPVEAERPLPPHDAAAVDGYAVFCDDLAPAGVTWLPVRGTVAAGHPLDRPARRGEALRIFTGAPLPPGPDTVVMQEGCQRDGGAVGIPGGVTRGSHRRRTGEDVAAGAVALAAGRRLQPQDLGLAAALGRSQLTVYRRPRVALFSGGDELRDPGEARSPGGLYDANRPVLGALLDQLGCAITDLGILPDDPATIVGALCPAAAEHDLVLGSAGMSVGDEDHIGAALVAAGGRLDLHRLAIKPGKPFGLGRVGKVPFIGLPGHPVAAVITFLLLARPLLLRLAGVTPVLPPPRFPVIAGFDYPRKRGRREYLAAILCGRQGRTPLAQRFPRQGSAVLSALVAADGLIELAEDSGDVIQGDVVDFLPLSALR